VVTHREALEALRDRLTAELEAAEGSGLASVSRELRATWSELESLPVPESKAPADEIARRRQARRQKAAGQ
jgi:hypothetical protein